VEIPESLYHEVNRSRGRFGEFGKPASFRRTVSLLLRGGE
jgi:hypothetical protein